MATTCFTCGPPMAACSATSMRSPSRSPTGPRLIPPAPSTQQAGAHPDLDFKITSPSGQLRTIDMFAAEGSDRVTPTRFRSVHWRKCRLLKIALPTRNSERSATIYQGYRRHDSASSGTRLYLGPNPSLPHEYLGLTIFVPSPLPDDYDSVRYPLRLQLVNNSQYLRTFSDSIPISDFVFQRGSRSGQPRFYVKTFDLHLSGSAGITVPVADQPPSSSCAPGSWDVDLGDTEANHHSAPAPYPTDWLRRRPIGPKLHPEFTNPTAGQGTGVHAVDLGTERQQLARLDQGARAVDPDTELPVIRKCGPLVPRFEFR